MAGFTDVYENSLLDLVFRNQSYTPPATVYVGLFTSAPNDAYTSGVPTGTEVSGGSYARTAATFGAASGGAISNSGSVTFPTSSAAWNSGSNITHFGVFEASSGGTMIGWGSITTPQAVGAANITLSFATGELDITLD